MRGMRSLHSSRQQRSLQSRSTAVQVQARASKVAQNHRRTDRPIQLDNDTLYTDASLLPARQFGPVASVIIKGQGRGLVLTGSVSFGELLFVSQPAGDIVRAAEGAALTPQDVQLTLQREGVLSADDRKRLMMLFNGQASSADKPLDLSQMITPKEQKAKPAEKHKGFGPAKPQEPSQQGELTPDLLERIVRYNAWSQDYADMGAAACRGEKSYAVAGLWPEHALLNHSCCPNTVTVLVGDRLLVRAVGQMEKDTHLTTSYIGFEAGSPLSERRQRLEQSYGFTCNCPRCKAESSLPQAITAQLELMWGWVKRHGPEAYKLVRSGEPQPQLHELQEQVDQQVEQLEALIAEHKVPDKLHRWVCASAYTSYELQSLLRYQHILERKQQGEQVAFDPNLWGRLIPMASVFAPASDLALFLSMDWLFLAGGGSPNAGQGMEVVTRDPRVGDAGATCMRLHINRYGRVSDAVFTKIMQEREKAANFFGRVDLPSHLSAVRRE